MQRKSSAPTLRAGSSSGFLDSSQSHPLPGGSSPSSGGGGGRKGSTQSDPGGYQPPKRKGPWTGFGESPAQARRSKNASGFTPEEQKMVTEIKHDISSIRDTIAPIIARLNSKGSPEGGGSRSIPRRTSGGGGGPLVVSYDGNSSSNRIEQLLNNYPNMSDILPEQATAEEEPEPQEHYQKQVHLSYQPTSAVGCGELVVAPPARMDYVEAVQDITARRSSQDNLPPATFEQQTQALSQALARQLPQPDSYTQQKYSYLPPPEPPTLPSMPYPLPNPNVSVGGVGGGLEVRSNSLPTFC